jgi:hypothetical protein
MRQLPSLLGMLLLLVLSFVSPDSRADCLQPSPYARLSLINAGGSTDFCNMTINGLSQISVVAFEAPVGKVRFALPDPPAGFSIVGESWAYPHTGSRLSGMEMTLGCSSTGVVTLGTLFVTPTGPVSSGDWRISPGCEAEDCDGNLQPAVSMPNTINSFDNCFQNCMGGAPYDLFPPMGETGVPTNVRLTWYGGWNFPNTTCSIRIGTDPGCSDAQTVNVPCDGDHGVTLDFLEPGTTYYWQASWFTIPDSCYNTGGTSIIFSFTTAGPLAVEAATWGKVKSMYRE